MSARTAFATAVLAAVFSCAMAHGQEAAGRIIAQAPGSGGPAPAVDPGPAAIAPANTSASVMGGSVYNSTSGSILGGAGTLFNGTGGPANAGVTGGPGVPCGAGGAPCGVGGLSTSAGPALGVWHDHGPPVSPVPCSCGLSDYITYRRENCCLTPTGNARPICMEIFVRSGVSLPLGGNRVADEMQTGWSIMGGSRALFFTPDWTRAWTIEAHVINTYQGAAGNEPFNLSSFHPDPQGQAKRVNFGFDGVPGVTIRSFNRTMAGLGFGREWYLWQPANAPGNHWRIGVDTGGRYGSASMNYNEIRHRADVVGSFFASAHTDYEINCGRCVYQAGFRAAYAYTWSDILQRVSDVQDINLMFTLGLRY